MTVSLSSPVSPAMPTLEDVANVALRVPAIVLLDLLYRWDVEKLRGEFSHPSYDTSFIYTHFLCAVYYLAHVVCAVLVILPLRHLLTIYLYLLTSLLLYIAHQTVRDYIRHEMDAGFSGTVYEDQKSLTRSVSTLTGLVMVCTLCSLLMRTRQAWLFSAPVLPLLARLTGLPLRSLPLLNAISTGATLLVMCYMAVSGFRPLFHLFAKAYEELVQAMELYRLVALGMVLWTQLAVPAVFLIFWVVLYLLQVYSALSSKPSILEQQGLVFILLNSVSECCGTPYCLLGLTSTVSYLALGMLNLCKFYLMGYAAFQNGNAMHRGVTEGVTMMLLSLQTGLLDLQVLQRTFLLSIIFFIVVTSTLQSMIEIADPIVLALAATGNRSVWKHVRGLSLCLFLLVFPTFMAYKIAYFFHMDFWLLILVSSCLLTSLQVLGTLFIYALFMMELFQDSRVERMDEIIYGVNAISRVLEFLVALCVVAYGTWESIFGEWSWMGVSVIIVHSYFNVWLRAQSGWRSFLLRREAARKISHLPRATEEELRAHNDVCSICFQEMSLAVITTCSHFFHADCLKKWLYVQDTCPLCHQPVRSVDRDDEEEEDGEESDSDERGAGEQGGISAREEDVVRLQGENVKESQTRDHAAKGRGMFVGENHHVVVEATYEEMELETEKVEEILLEKREHIVYWVLEEKHYAEEKEEEVYLEKQDDEVLCKKKHKKEVSWSQEEVLHREEQPEGYTCRENQKKKYDLLSTNKVPCKEGAKVLYQEDQEMVNFRNSGQLHSRKAEEIHDREEEDVACSEKEQVFCREEPEEFSSKQGVQFLYRGMAEEGLCPQDENQEVLCTKEMFVYSKVEEAQVPCKKPVRVLSRKTEEMGEKDQEAVPCIEEVQVLYTDIEDLAKEDLYKKGQDVVSSTKPLQVLQSEVEEEDHPCRDVPFRETEEDPYREHEEGAFSREETCFLADKTGNDWTAK